MGDYHFHHHLVTYIERICSQVPEPIGMELLGAKAVGSLFPPGSASSSALVEGGLACLHPCVAFLMFS